jgi:Sec-independent protein translocase protein TatA
MSHFFAFGIGPLGGAEFAILVVLFLIFFGSKRITSAARSINPWNIKKNFNAGRKEGVTVGIKTTPAQKSANERQH